MPINIFGSELYGLEEIAEILGLSRETVANYARRGLIETRRIGRKYYATREAIAEIGKRGTHPKPAPRVRKARAVA